MKKIYFAIIALSACALVACNKQEKEIVNDVPETVEMTVIAGDAATKTALSGATIIWSGTEKLQVVEEVTGGTDNGKCFAKESSAGSSSDAGATMNFNVTLDSHTGATSFRYAAFYPSSAFQAVTNMSNVAVNTPYEQSPTTDSYDPAADLLISEISASSASQPTNINMAFARKVAIGKMTVKNLASSDDIVSVTFSAKQGATDVTLAGRSKVDFATSTVSYGSNLKVKSLTMDYSGDGVKMNTAAGAPVYFVCYPFELNVANSGEFTVVVETATHRYTRNVVLTGAQTLNFTAGDVSRFSVDMTSADVVAKAVSLHYAEYTRADAYAAGATGNSYVNISSDKTHGDKWSGRVSYYNDGFGLRNTSSTNDSYLKLPDFVEKIMTVTVELSVAFVHNNKPEIDTYLSLESASDLASKSIASLDQVDDQMTYVFDLSAGDVKTAYLRATGNPAYVKRVIVTTAKADTRTQLSAPTGVAAALDGTNDIEVSWTKAADAVGYVIVCTPTSGDPVVIEVGDVATHTLTALPNNTTFTVSVTAIPDYYVHTESTAANASSTVTTKAGVTYSKYTSALVEGDYILIGSTNHAMKNTITSNKLSYQTVSISENKITNPDAALVWHIAQSGDYWTIYNAAAEKYAAGIENVKNQATLSNSVTDYTKWSVTLASNVFDFVNKGRAADSTDPNNKYLRSNGNSGFGCYLTGTGTKITLYKKD